MRNKIISFILSLTILIGILPSAKIVKAETVGENESKFSNFYNLTASYLTETGINIENMQMLRVVSALLYKEGMDNFGFTSQDFYYATAKLPSFDTQLKFFASKMKNVDTLYNMDYNFYINQNNSNSIKYSAMTHVADKPYWYITVPEDNQVFSIHGEDGTNLGQLNPLPKGYYAIFITKDASTITLKVREMGSSTDISTVTTNIHDAASGIYLRNELSTSCTYIPVSTSYTAPIATGNLFNGMTDALIDSNMSVGYIIPSGSTIHSSYFPINLSNKKLLNEKLVKGANITRLEYNVTPALKVTTPDNLHLGVISSINQDNSTKLDMRVESDGTYSVSVSANTKVPEGLTLKVNNVAVDNAGYTTVVPSTTSYSLSLPIKYDIAESYNQLGTVSNTLKIKVSAIN